MTASVPAKEPALPPSPVEAPSEAGHGAAPPSPGQEPEKSTRSTGLIIGVVAACVAGVVLIYQATRTSPLAHKNEASSAEPTVPRVEDGVVLVPQSFRQRLGLEAVAATEAPLTPVVRANGTVTFNPQVSAAVSTRIRGTIRRILKVEGDEVKEGEVVAELESAELGTAQSEVTVAKANLAASEANLAREEALRQKSLSTARELEVAMADVARDRALLVAAEQKVRALGGDPQGPLGLYFIRAPLAGTVIERHLSQGQAVDGSELLLQTTDLSRVWVELDIFNQHMDAIRENDAVEIHPVGRSTDITRGKISHVGDVIDEETRTAQMRVVVDNRARKLRPGQAVVASIHASGPARTTLLVPRNAVTLVDGKATVFVEEGPTRFVPTEVKTGGQDGANVEILDGLQPGDRVVTAGLFGLKAELFR